MRINKYLSACGLGSRRACDLLVTAGRVTIDGQLAESGSQVEENMRVCLDGREVEKKAQKEYLCFYKPRGIVCTASKKERNNIIDYLNYPIRITYAGRLDKESEGLMLMTDDGELINALMSAGDFHEKEYEVTVGRSLCMEDLKKMEQGVYLEEINRTTRPAKVKKLSEYRFQIVLTEGINREIRRICKVFHYPVRSLKRIRINTLNLGDLKPGEYRKLTAQEIQRLKRSVEEAGHGRT